MARTTPVHAGYFIINGSGTGPNGDRIDVWIEYIVAEQSIEQNRSRVIAYFYAALRPGESSSTYGGNGCYSSFTVNGVSGQNLKNNGSYDFRTTTPNLLGSIDAEHIFHNEDGTKTITLSGSFTTKSSWITGGNVSGNVTMPAIPRATTPAIPPATTPGVPASITMGEEITIDLSGRASSSFTHTIRYYFNGALGTLATKTSSTSVNWTPPLSLAEYIPNATSGQGNITVETFSGDTMIGSKTVFFTLIVPDDIVPDITDVTLEMVSDNEVVQTYGVFVKGYSKAKITVTAQGAYGSTITSYSFAIKLDDEITVFSKSQPGNIYTSGIISQAGDYTFPVSVTDSRGRQATFEFGAFTVLDYSPPSVSQIEVFRCIADGTKDISTGTYISAKARFAYSDVDGYNTLRKKIEFRKLGAGGWQTGINDPDSDVAYVFGGGNISVASTYEVAFTVEDDVAGAVVYTVRVLPGVAALHVRPGGKGIGIGGACDTDDQMQVYWDSVFNRNVVFNDTVSFLGAKIRAMAFGVTTASPEGVAVSFPAGRFKDSTKMYVFFGQRHISATGEAPVAPVSVKYQTLTASGFVAVVPSGHSASSAFWLAIETY